MFSFERVTDPQFDATGFAQFLAGRLTALSNIGTVEPDANNDLIVKQSGKTLTLKEYFDHSKEDPLDPEEKIHGQLMNWFKILS